MKILQNTKKALKFLQIHEKFVFALAGRFSLAAQSNIKSPSSL